MRIDPETLILRALLDGEAYATQIIERIEELSDGELTISIGTIQPTLARMWRRGLVNRAERNPDEQEPRSGRRRMYYWVDWLIPSEGTKRARRNYNIMRKMFSGALP